MHETENVGVYDYQLAVKRSKVKVTRSLSRVTQDQPLQLGLSNLEYLSALLRRGHCHIAVLLFSPLALAGGRRPKGI